MENEKIAKSISDILLEIGEDTGREGLKDTPNRVAKSFQKLFGGYNEDPNKILTTFDGEDYDEMIICKDIDFYSTCEHHMLPFFGKVSIGYIPTKRIAGISKLPRLVEIFARRLQNQERLTMQIANSLYNMLEPKGLGVIIEGKHLCMMSRGIEKQNAVMTTSTFKGLFKNDNKTRTEFLRLIS